MKMNFDFPNEIEKINIDVEIPKPVITIEERRDIMLKRFARINIAVFSVLLVSSSAFLTFGKRPTVSETENRTLAAFPEFSVKSLLSGEYTAGIAEFYNDTVPMRRKFKDLAASIKDYSGIELDGMKVYSVNSNQPSSGQHKSGNSAQNPAVVTTVKEDIIQSETITEVSSAEISDVSESVTAPAETTAAVTTAPPAPIPEDDTGDAGELSNNIMIYKNRGIPIYYGSFESGVEYASIVNEYKLRLGDSVNVFSMVCPTAMSFYWPASSDISHGDEAENLENIKNHLVGVTDVNTIPALREHRSEHIYSRTDHHWQARGAYYAAQVFAEKAGVPFADISKYEEVTVPGYVGTLYGYSGASVLNENPEDFVFYRPSNQYTTRYYSTGFEYQYEGALLVEAYGSSLYCTFMGGDEKIVHVETDAPNDRTLFIIKDSYGNALVPFLTGSFKNIFVVDMRYFDLNIINFMKEHNATDLLFAMNTFSATGSNYYNLQTLLNQ